MIAVDRLLTASRKAATAITDGLNDVRMRRLRLLDKRDELAARPLPKDEALAALDRDIDALVTDGLDAHVVHGLTRAERPSWAVPPNGVLLALLIGASRVTFRELIAQQLNEHYDQRGLQPISAEEREAAIRRIDEELRDLEIAEESTIRLAEAEGVALLRRADASPAVVLAADQALGL